MPLPPNGAGSTLRVRFRCKAAPRLVAQPLCESPPGEARQLSNFWGQVTDLVDTRLALGGVPFKMYWPGGGRETNKQDGRPLRTANACVELLAER